MTIFSRNAVSNDKNEYNLFYGKWGTEYSFEILPHTGRTKAKKTKFGDTFSPISGVVMDQLFPKKKLGSPMSGLAPTM